MGPMPNPDVKAGVKLLVVYAKKMLKSNVI
jgi:hypothetical protein